MKKKKPAARIKTMKAAKKKKTHRDTGSAIEKKLAEIKMNSRKNVPAYTIPSLFQYA